MDQHYSNLELVRHDETARAPERDYGITTLELDASVLAPQTVPDTTPQVFYSTLAPELHEKKSVKENAASLRVAKLALKWPWILTVVVVTAIAIGVGVGVWRHRDLSHAPSAPRPLVPQTPQNTSSPNITRAEQYILNDTSLAALIHTNGDRQLFFQDNTGLIRNAIRTSTDTQWIMGPDINVSSNVKKYTPLAVNLLLDSVSPSESPSIILYYVSENHFLQSTFFLGSSWTGIPPLQNITTAVDTRSLCIGSLYNATSTLNFGALLFYENSNGNVSALFRMSNAAAVDEFGYLDISHERKALPDKFRNVQASDGHAVHHSAHDLPLSGPFACPSNWTSASTNAGFGAEFYSGPYSSESLFYTNDLLSNGTFNFGNFSRRGYAGNYSLIPQSDVAMFDPTGMVMWINGTQPALLPGYPYQGFPVPENAFPFKRLASANLLDQSATFLYHQMNGTMFAEEQWVSSLSIWKPTVYIPISIF